MAKISDFVEKTALEVEDTDVLAIEDAEDTKKITVGSLKEVLRPVQEAYIKSIVNETLDRISEALLGAKWELVEATLCSFQLNTWIGSASGNIQVALYDEQAEKWLTREEITELFNRDEETYSIEAHLGPFWEKPVSWDVRSFNEEHEAAEEINEWLYRDDAGFIKMHFDGLTQNQISRIIYEDISIKMDDDRNEEDEVVTRYLFRPSRDSFSNAVPWESTVPGCPCIYHAKDDETA